MKKIIGIFLTSAVLYACSGGTKEENGNTSANSDAVSSTGDNANPSYDPKRGEGKFTKVDVGATLDATMADAGKKVFDVKCSACHKLTTEKLVGPGWSGVTSRHASEWIMNFITNTDEMISKDPAAQAQLEICLVRMPNQNLSDDDARHLLEFMRKNDGVK
jgi:cytochrome c551/c552